MRPGSGVAVKARSLQEHTTDAEVKRREVAASTPSNAILHARRRDGQVTLDRRDRRKNLVVVVHYDRLNRAGCQIHSGSSFLNGMHNRDLEASIGKRAHKIQ